MNRLAIVYKKQKQFVKYKIILHDLEVYCPNDSNLHLEIAKMYFSIPELKNVDLAYKYILKCYKCLETYAISVQTSILEMLIAISLNPVHFSQDREDLTYKYIEQYSDLTNSSPKSDFFRSQYFYKKLNFDACIEWLDKAVLRDKENKLYQSELKNIILGLYQDQEILMLTNRFPEKLIGSTFDEYWSRFCLTNGIKDESNRKQLVRRQNYTL
jgi:Rps23 Pro-64 3,4-dihydroxylase Tpa1-like proline 4-hydroxylase